MSINLPRAVRANRVYLRQSTHAGARPIDRFNQIIDLLGFTASSPGEEQFALAVADWQALHSPPLPTPPDGMLGPRTWRLMEPDTRFAADPRGLPAWVRQLPPAEAPAGPPPAIRRPPPEGVTRTRGGLGGHPAYDEHFSAGEMLRHHLWMEVRSAGLALGMLHATLTWLARRGPDFDPDPVRAEDPLPGGVVDSYADAGPRVDWGRQAVTDEGEEFLQALDDGLISRGPGRGEYHSTVQSRQEYLDLEAHPEFATRFAEAYRDQWSTLRAMALVDAYLTIVDVLTFWTGGGVARRGATAAVRAAGTATARAAVAGGLRAIARRALSMVRSLIARLRRFMRRLIGTAPGSGPPTPHGPPRLPPGPNPPRLLPARASRPRVSFDWRRDRPMPPGTPLDRRGRPLTVRNLEGGLDHVAWVHGPWSREGRAGRFDQDFWNTVREHIQRAVDNGTEGTFVPNPALGVERGSVWEYTFEGLSRIGTNINGAATRRMRVVLDDTGQLITAFPF